MEEEASPMVSRLEQQFRKQGMKSSVERCLIAAVLSEATDHPSAEEIFDRVSAMNPKVHLSTVYRNLEAFEAAGLVTKHEFGDGRARYEEAAKPHHDHLIDVQSGHIVEFHDAALEAELHKVASRLGYSLTGYRLELYGIAASCPEEPSYSNRAGGSVRDRRGRPRRALAARIGNER